MNSKREHSFVFPKRFISLDSIIQFGKMFLSTLKIHLGIHLKLLNQKNWFFFFFLILPQNGFLCNTRKKKGKWKKDKKWTITSSFEKIHLFWLSQNLSLFCFPADGERRSLPYLIFFHEVPFCLGYIRLKWQCCPEQLCCD